MTENTEDYKGKTCSQCAYLTEHAPIHISGELAEEEKGLCRLLILHNNFAIMLKKEIACPEFIPK
jgi:RNA polymerase subunit RPABC4/transcription elongation factor Spt4